MRRRLQLLGLLCILLPAALSGPASWTGAQGAPPLAPGSYILQLESNTLVPVAADAPPSPAPTAWSPDGAQLARGGAALDLVDAATGAVTAVLSDLDPPVQVLRWSPDGSRLAFLQGSAITVLNADGTAADTVVALPARSDAGASENTGVATPAAPPFLDVAWTPDGLDLTTLQVYQDGSGDWQGVVSEVDAAAGTTVATPLSGSSAACFASLSWSPDGAFLALAGPQSQGCPNAGGTNGLWSWEAATGSLRQLHAGGVVAAKWAADGSLVAEVCCDGFSAAGQATGQAAGYSLVRFRPDGSAQTVLASGLAGPVPAPYGPAFDVAGGSVLYTRYDTTGGCQARHAWAIAAGAASPRQISDAGSSVYDPRLAPDGASAAWIRAQADGSEIDVAAIDGSNARAVLTGASGLDNLHWSPDGTALSFDVTPQQNDSCPGG